MAMTAAQTNRVAWRHGLEKARGRTRAIGFEK
jgi:hypothetical protein